MMAKESIDLVLQGLLDAFPSAPLELIASAFTQANSDPDLAAEIIAFSLSGISSNPPKLPNLCLADQRSPSPPPHCSKDPSFDLHGIKDANVASWIHKNSSSIAASEMHERLKFREPSSYHVSTVLDGVLHACDDQASHLHSRAVSSLRNNTIPSGELHVPGSRASYDGYKGASNAKQSHDFITLSHRLPLPRPKGPCPPTLEEYFPSSPEKNAWLEPLSKPLQKNVPLQSQQKSSPECEIQQGFYPDEFPSLEKRTSKEKGEIIPSSGLLRPLRSSNRSLNRTSAAFGLASSARTRRRDDSSTRTSPAEEKKSTINFKLQETKDEEKLLWPTDTEASLLTRLGDEFNLSIEAVRDVLGHYQGDIEKSFEVLLQLSSSSSSNDNAMRSALKFGIVDTRDTSLSQGKEVAAVAESAERRGIISMPKGENCSARQIQAIDPYYAFEEAILKQENSSMKWVVECLCNKYPQADMSTLLEVLRATNFDFNDAEKMLQEAGVHEGFPISEEKRDPSQLSKMILESLFNKPEEVNEIQENHKRTFERKKEREAAKLPDIPKWKVITSNELDISGDEESRGHIKAHEVMGEWKVGKFSEMAVSKNEGGNRQMKSYGDWDDYERHRASAKQHWKTMQSYLKAATAAYADSDFSKAELLTEKGNLYKQLSMEAKERANPFLLEMKSQQNESDFTLDLQDQHVTEALQLLRLHLKSFSSIPSCHTFTVVTGCFKDTKSGHIKIKNEVVRYLQKKGYEWVETSPFCLQIQLKKANQLELVRERVQGADQTAVHFLCPDSVEKGQSTLADE